MKKWCGRSEERTILLYRGFRMNEERIFELFPQGQEIRLMGYTSTSRDVDVALRFALKDLERKEKEIYPVIMQIYFSAESAGMFEILNTDNKKRTAFDDEKEVLL